jgi:hypothetical protein
MDFDAHLRETARHLVWMANLPGQLALAHSKHRAVELIASSPLYANLAELVMEARSEAASAMQVPSVELRQR